MSKKQKIISGVVAGIYLVLLTWLILFKLSVDFEEICKINYRSINLVPFSESVIVNGKLELSEIIYNILAFVPLGVYIQMFKPDWSIIKKFLPGFVLSLTYETIQFIFSIGASDVTDLIGNTLGGIIGVGLCCLIKKLCKKNYVSVINTIGIAAELIFFTLFALLTLANV